MTTNEQQEQVTGWEGRIVRIQLMVHEVLDELRTMQLDEAARTRVAAIYDESVSELLDVLSVGMCDELRRFVTQFHGDGTGSPPSPAELLIADAQLAGWLDGLVRGVQARLVLRALAQGKGDDGPPSISPPVDLGSPYL